jgi:outer membrane protein TolC
MKQWPTFLSLYVVLLVLYPVLLSAQNEERTLTFETVLESAILHYPEIRMANIEQEKAELQRKMVLQTYLPKATLEANYTWLDDPLKFNLPPMSIELAPGMNVKPEMPDIYLQDDVFYKANIRIEQVLFTGGRIPNKARAVREKSKSLGYMAEAKKSDIISVIAEAWDRLALIRESILVVDEGLERVRFEYERSVKAYEKGLIPYFDLTKIRYFEQELIQQKNELQGNLILTCQLLEMYTGIPAEEFRITEAGLVELNIDEKSKEDANIWQKRPEYLAADHAVKANQNAIRAQRGNYMPQVFAYYHREFFEDELSVLDPVRAVGVGLRWEIFNRGQTTRKYQLAQRERSAAIEQQRMAERGLKLKYQQALTDIDNARLKIETANIMKNEAETSLKLSERRYELGLATIGERLEAEVEFQNAKFQMNRALFDHRRSVIDYLQSTAQLSPKTMAQLSGKF